MRHFPDIPQELKKSYQNISGAMREKRSKGFAGQAMDAMTGGLAAVASECVRLPVNVLVVPVAKTVNDAVRTTVKGTLGLTGDLIARIPWLPVPGGRNTPRAAPSQPRTIELASLYDQLPPPLHGPDHPGSRSGQGAYSANA